MSTTLTREQIAQNLEEYIKQTCEGRAAVCLIALEPLLRALKTDQLTLKLDKDIIRHTGTGAHFSDLVSKLKELMPEIEQVVLLSISAPVEQPAWMTNEAYQELCSDILNEYDDILVSSIDFDLNPETLQNSVELDDPTTACQNAWEALTTLFMTGHGLKDNITAKIHDQFIAIVGTALELMIIAAQQDKLQLLLQSADWIWVGTHALPLGFKRGTKTVVCLVR